MAYSIEYKYTCPLSWLSTSIIFIVLVFSEGTVAQNQEQPLTKRSTSTFFFEAFGNGILYSVNYDQVFIYNERSGMSLRGGLSLYPETNGLPTYVVPIELNYFGGGSEKVFEMGIGANFVNYDGNMWPSVRFGYRRQKVAGGLFLRFSLLLVYTSYLIEDEVDEKEIVPTIGLSFGYSIPRKKG